MIISSSLKNGTSVDRRLCTSTYRDYSKTPYRNYGKTPCLLQDKPLIYNLLGITHPEPFPVDLSKELF